MKEEKTMLERLSKKEVERVVKLFYPGSSVPEINFPVNRQDVAVAVCTIEPNGKGERDIVLLLWRDKVSGTIYQKLIADGKEKEGDLLEFVVNSIIAEEDSIKISLTGYGWGGRWSGVLEENTYGGKKVEL